MEVVLAFFDDNLTAIVVALFAAGGAGTLLLKHFLGGAKDTQSATVTANNGGIAVHKTNRGDVSINQAVGPKVNHMALARQYGVPHVVTLDAIERLDQQTRDDETLERRFAAFAEEWGKLQERVEQLTEMGRGEDRRLTSARKALARGDVKRAAKLCSVIEAEFSSAPSSSSALR